MKLLDDSISSGASSVLIRKIIRNLSKIGVLLGMEEVFASPFQPCQVRISAVPLS